MITPQHYVSEDQHQREIKSLFSESWIFAGLGFELEGLSHRGIQIADKSIVLQKDRSGRPRAFLNVCSHRHSRLCDVGLHAGAIRCPYHGWVYDRDGLPAGIPMKGAFPDVISSPGSYRLQEFPCDTAGEFIFVRLSSQGPSLADYLGNQYGFLERASTGMSVVTDEFTRELDANWKVVIENSLEGYHVPTVHSHTFMQVDGMDTADDAPRFFLENSGHSYLEHAANTDWLARFNRIEKKIGQWPWRFEHYTHHHIFPNLTVTSFMGYSFHVQVFQPTTFDKTTVHSRTIGMLLKSATPTGKKMMEKIYSDGHSFTHRVFSEDADICAKVHQGLRDAQRLAVLGEGIEDRVKHFQRIYLKKIF